MFEGGLSGAFFFFFPNEINGLQFSQALLEGFQITQRFSVGGVAMLACPSVYLPTDRDMLLRGFRRNYKWKELTVVCSSLSTSIHLF